jgi:DNA-binding MarR family transcriptional regulator
MAEDVQNATSRAVMIAEMVCKGCSHSEIAEALGVHRNTALRAVNSPEVEEEVERMMAEARKAARRAGQTLASKAGKVWEEALKASTGCPKCNGEMPDHNIRLRAADSVADRFGLPRTELQEVAATLTMADKSDAEIEREVLEEAAAILDRAGKHETARAVREAM